MKPIDQQTDAELLRELRSAVRELPDVPEALQRAAVGLWPATAPLASLYDSAGALLRHVLAELSFDSWATPVSALGMRSLNSPTRHLLFSAAGRDIDLRVVPGTDGFALAGQILGPDEAGTVELAAEGHGPGQHATLDALGEFRIERVVAGTYTVTLRMGGDEIVLPSIDVGPARR